MKAKGFKEWKQTQECKDMLSDLFKELDIKPIYNIEKVNGDNRRPETPKNAKYIVRYNANNFGWSSTKYFETEKEAEEFARKIEELI